MSLVEKEIKQKFPPHLYALFSRAGELVKTDEINKIQVSQNSVIACYELKSIKQVSIHYTEKEV